MEFVTDLQFPHSSDDTAVPHSWITDAPKSAGAEAFGLLITVLSYVRPGQATPLSEVEQSLHPGDGPTPLLVDRLVEAGRTELDLAKRKALYGDAQRILAEDLPIVPLWHEDNVVLANVGVRDYTIVPNARFIGLVGTSKSP